MRLPILWMLTVIPTFAAKLELLAIEVSKPLVEKTMNAAIDKDHDALDNALDNLRKLTPEQGVVEHAAVALILKAGDKHAHDEKFKNSPSIPDRPRPQYGHSVLWTASGNLRMLDLRFVSSAVAAPIFSAKFHHHPESRWSLSAATTTLNGVLFVFERMEDDGKPAAASAWVLATISDEKIPDDKLPASPGQWFANPPSRYAMMLRKPDDPEFRFGEVIMSLRPYAPTMKDYLSSSFSLNLNRAGNPDITKPIASMGCDIVKTSTATELQKENGGKGITLDPQVWTSGLNIPSEVSLVRTVRKGDTTSTTSVSPRPIRYFHSSVFQQP